MKNFLLTPMVSLSLKATLALSLLVMFTGCNDSNKAAIAIENIEQEQPPPAQPLGEPKPPTPVNGSCGLTDNTCLSGLLLDSTDSSTQYLWSCSGANGGTNASCSLDLNLSLACDILEQ